MMHRVHKMLFEERNVRALVPLKTSKILKTESRFVHCPLHIMIKDNIQGGYKNAIVIYFYRDHTDGSSHCL
jgi:hypothetical protein